LGFIRYNCTGVDTIDIDGDSLFDDAEDDQTASDDILLTEDQAELIATGTGAIGLVIISVIATMSVMCLFGCCCFYIMAKFQTKKKM